MGEPRTDSSFRNRQHPDFHNVTTPIEILPINLISQIPLCSLHLFDLGVMRKILNLYLKLYFKNESERNNLSQKLKQLKSYITDEFNGKTKELDLPNWKGHDFRRFLLYEAPIVLLSFLPPKVYEHFLLLHLGYRLLFTPSEHNLNLAQQCFEHFVSSFNSFFGNHLTYNIHNLLHITDHVSIFGEPDSFSTYKFENYFQKIKKSIRSPINIMTQLSNFVTRSSHELNFNAQQKNPQLNLKFPNNIYILNDNRPIFLTSFYTDSNNVSLKGKTCNQISNFYDKPVNSSCLGIVKANRNDFEVNITVNINTLKGKFLCLPHDECFVFFPLLHLYNYND